MDEKRLDRLEKSVDSLHGKIDRVLDDHSNRLTSIETQAGFIKGGLGLFTAALIWALNKFFK